eukprot:g57523.t1
MVEAREWYSRTYISELEKDLLSNLSPRFDLARFDTAGPPKIKLSKLNLTDSQLSFRKDGQTLPATDAGVGLTVAVTSHLGNPAERGAAASAIRPGCGRCWSLWLFKFHRPQTEVVTTDF